MSSGGAGEKDGQSEEGGGPDPAAQRFEDGEGCHGVAPNPCSEGEINLDMFSALNLFFGGVRMGVADRTNP